MDFLGMAATIDLDNHTSFHLEAQQAFLWSIMIHHYADSFTSESKKLLELSNAAMADAWFIKKAFVDAVLESGFDFIKRLRGDANLKYLYQGPKVKGRGRPKLFDGKLMHKNINADYFQTVELKDGTTDMTALKYSVALKRIIRMVRVKMHNNYKLYFSTDNEMDAATLVQYYQRRFQIDFVYRDAKQHTGHEKCQSRSINKLNFTSILPK